VVTHGNIVLRQSLFEYIYIQDRPIAIPVTTLALIREKTESAILLAFAISVSRCSWFVEPWEYMLSQLSFAGTVLSFLALTQQYLCTIFIP
jgi:hypothetical protein